MAAQSRTAIEFVVNARHMPFPRYNTWSAPKHGITKSAHIESDLNEFKR